MSTTAFRKGDVVWCSHIQNERVKGIIDEKMKGKNYRVKVLLPKLKGEESYFSVEILGEHELHRIMD